METGSFISEKIFLPWYARTCAYHGVGMLVFRKILRTYKLMIPSSNLSFCITPQRPIYDTSKYLWWRFLVKIVTLFKSNQGEDLALEIEGFQRSKLLSSCLVNWLNTVSTKCIYSSYFSGSILVMIYLKCWDLEHFKKFPIKHETDWNYSTAADFLHAILQNYSQLISLLLLLIKEVCNGV